MKLKMLEARYAAQRTIPNLLTFFEEKDHMVLEHRAFVLRKGLVCYYAGHEVEEIEDQNGTYYVALESESGSQINKKLLNDETITSVYVFKLDRVF